MTPESNQLIRTDTRQWDIVLRRKGYFFVYRSNSYHLENAKDKDECFVFRYNKSKDSKFIVLISSKKEDYVGIICLTKNCEVLWEKNYAEASTYWKSLTKDKGLHYKPFFSYSPTFQIRNLLLKKPSTFTKKENKEGFFKDWLPFSMGICVGIIYTLLGFLIFNHWIY
jgi:hypothetical protein